MSYGRSVVVDRPFAEALAATREALADQGFGVLTEIDMAATLKKKLDVDIPPQVILGACNPPFAHQALVTEESIGLLLPCNVVVRQDADGRTVVATLDPQVMVTLTGNPGLVSIAQDAAERLATVLATVQTPAS
jgi:uncharacterized protein (DUF302 family)